MTNDATRARLQRNRANVTYWLKTGRYDEVACLLSEIIDALPKSDDIGEGRKK